MQRVRGRRGPGTQLRGPDQDREEDQAEPDPQAGHRVHVEREEDHEPAAMAIPVQPTRRPLVGRKRSTGAAPAVSGPAVMPRFCPGPVDSPHSHGRTYDLPVTTVVNPATSSAGAAQPCPGRGDVVRRRAAPLPARPARRRPGRRRGPRRHARHPVDQDHRQGVRDRPGDPDGRPHHARGPGHPRQGAGAVREGDAARPRRPDLPAGRPRCASTPTWWRWPRRPWAAAACTWPRSPPRSRRAGPRSTSSSPTPRTRSRPAPTRSTW